MQLDEDTLYRAIESRDRRFEGRFVIGVVTTGVYCRPGCPARLPQRRNVRFYACAAAAEDAGFRACLRCRPEASPGSPARLGTGATVTRALRLIAEGGLDGEHTEELAARLGVGERHLRRLFAEHLGTSPLSIARSRRLHFARKLLDETALPVAEIANAAGFSSLRRFNDEVKGAFGAPPTELRRARGGRVEVGDGSTVSLRLPYKPPYEFDAILAFLAARATPGVEVVAGRAYRRAVSIEGARGAIEVRAARGRDSLELQASIALAPALSRVVGRVSRLFDLGADPAAIAEHLGKDRRLARAVARRPGLRVPGAWCGFELAVRAVLGQQVSVRAATTLAGRLAAAFGERIEGDPGLLFPTAAALAQADVASIGLPAARAETIRRIARAVAGGEIDLDAPGDLDEARARLTAIPGVGAWTAAYVAMRAFGEPDALPASDLALRRALARGGEPVGARDVEQRAEAWRPWRSYAAMHLWTSEAGGER